MSKTNASGKSQQQLLALWISCWHFFPTLHPCFLRETDWVSIKMCLWERCKSTASERKMKPTDIRTDFMSPKVVTTQTMSLFLKASNWIRRDAVSNAAVNGVLLLFYSFLFFYFVIELNWYGEIKRQMCMHFVDRRQGYCE